MKKRSISIFMSLLLLLSVIQPAAALDIDPDFEQIYEIGTRLLGDIEHEKEMYGLKDVDFNNLYIGEYIPAYEAEETGLILSDTRYYPILEDGRWVATLICYKTDGIWNGQLSNMFVPELPEIGVNDSLKLVFDVNKSYLMKNTDANELKIFDDVEGRVSIDIAPMTARTFDNGGQKLINKRAVEIRSFDDGVCSYSSVPTEKYLNIPKIQQIQPMSCSLAALQSIAQYFYKIYTQQGLCNLYPVPGEVTLDTGATLHQLQHICSAIALNSNYYTRANFSFSMLKDSIYNNCPLIGACTPTAGSVANGGHSVAIRGYNTYTSSTINVGSFAFMDPWDASYYVGTVSNSNTYAFSIVRSNGTSSYRVQEFLSIGE